MTTPPIIAGIEISEFVTATVDGLLIGVPIGLVRDVFEVHIVTPVPLAPPFVMGITNLRGRIVTLLDLRQRIGLPPAPGDGEMTAIGFDIGRESYGIVVDAIGEVIRLDDARRDLLDASRSGGLADITACVYRLDDGLMAALDVKALRDVPPDAKAA